ncbi:MAG: tRNA (adenosine(37)-N6)-threonylcarbamoyltransferase complex dimerization subunit type 1 TsaB [Bacteroidales bacterium]|jgi:tRNA threonylcarbamoyladenosine biosynthesis protein TsaB|nr:tRNA (adenosine(37)-N6)-threonylcarbamoyltransferase complex dimerization subunit type 1 TsaB [Bacteroidales bacterium]MBQ4442534.1 tRNA (adenosine(37)-N6)-threonylcarbamoyltransferase complex dimerization subunit type 1 TsaB [Bacteroidales bacterium]
MKDNPILLHIETATEVCSVALSEGDRLLSVCESDDGNSHSKNLLPYIDKACHAAGITLQDIDGVSVSVGPGSYTGLRIGVSTAKGIAYSLNVPVMAVGTLESIANGAFSECDLLKESPSTPFQIASMIDARRMEVFTARYDGELKEIAVPSALIVDEHAYDEPLSQSIVVFCGNGMPKCRELLAQHANARFAEFPISARHLLVPALRRWKAREFADTAYFEPFYLKEYVAAKPHVKGL